MKRGHLLAVVEKAVGRTMKTLAEAHPEALQGHLAQSIEKRLIGMLGAELLLAMGHQPGTRLRASSDGYKPSRGVRQMQRPQAAPMIPSDETRDCTRDDFRSPLVGNKQAQTHA